MSQNRKVLVFNPSFLGDTLLTTPLLEAIYSHTGVKPDICLRPEAVSLLRGKNLYFLGDMLVFDKKGTDSGFAGMAKIANQIVANNYDLIISPHGSFRTKILLTWVKLRMMLRKPVLFAGFTSLINLPFDLVVKKPKNMHEVDRLLTLGAYSLCQRFEEFTKRAGAPTASIDDDFKEKLSKYLKTLGQAPYVGFSPGSVWNTKRYPAERYAIVANKLIDDGASIFIFGDKSEMDVCQAMYDGVQNKNRVVNLAGELPLDRFSTYISEMDLMFTNDSLPLHISVSHGTKLVSIFGPTTQDLGFYPYKKSDLADSSVVVEHKTLYCRPCGRHGHNVCPEEHFKCMLELEPEEIYKIASEKLREVA